MGGGGGWDLRELLRAVSMAGVAGAAGAGGQFGLIDAAETQDLLGPPGWRSQTGSSLAERPIRSDGGRVGARILPVLTGCCHTVRRRLITNLSLPDCPTPVRHPAGVGLAISLLWHGPRTVGQQSQGR